MRQISFSLAENGVLVGFYMDTKSDLSKFNIELNPHITNLNSISLSTPNITQQIALPMYGVQGSLKSKSLETSNRKQYLGSKDEICRVAGRFNLVCCLDSSIKTFLNSHGDQRIFGNLGLDYIPHEVLDEAGSLLRIVILSPSPSNN
jgi:hypothetical protein